MPECSSDLQSRVDLGVSFLTVNGTVAKTDFDSDEFVAPLKR